MQAHKLTEDKLIAGLVPELSYRNFVIYIYIYIYMYIYVYICMVLNVIYHN